MISLDCIVFITNLGFPYEDEDILKIIAANPYINTYYQLLSTFSLDIVLASTNANKITMSPFVDNNIIQYVKSYMLKYPNFITASVLTNPIFILYVPEIDIYQNRMIYPAQLLADLMRNNKPIPNDILYVEGSGSLSPRRL